VVATDVSECFLEIYRAYRFIHRHPYLEIVQLKIGIETEFNLRGSFYILSAITLEKSFVHDNIRDDYTQTYFKAIPIEYDT
jgi:hypothetical protein